MKTQHTPVPWAIGIEYDHLNIYGPVDRGKFPIVAGWKFPMAQNPPDEIRKNAEFIVRAVNSHDALLEAVKLAREHVAAWRNSVNAEDWQRGQTMLRLEAVLAEAIAEAEGRP